MGEDYKGELPKGIHSEREKKRCHGIRGRGKHPFTGYRENPQGTGYGEKGYKLSQRIENF